MHLLRHSAIEVVDAICCRTKQKRAPEACKRAPMQMHTHSRTHALTHTYTHIQAHAHTYTHANT